jgi:hypothetical protein
MNNTKNFNKNQDLKVNMLPKYNFDYSKARPNRFATSKDKTITVKLESDIAEVFKTIAQDQEGK